jgi:hypothetical protein
LGCLKEALPSWATAMYAKLLQGVNFLSSLPPKIQNFDVQFVEDNY